LAACGPTYSPDTYASNAVQQANKVEQGVVVGVRDVDVSASGAVGTVAGAAAGGIAGSQVAAGPISALSALGGSLVGGIAGSAVEHATEDTKAFEYIVRKPNGDLVSVTQKDKTPLVLGMHVLVISGVQARVVPDYTVPPDVTAGKPPEPAKPATPPPSSADAAPPKPAETPPAAVIPPSLIPAEAQPVAAALTGANPSPAIVVPSIPVAPGLTAGPTAKP
jgi:outer membrane lipoprotein SlyB